MFGFSASQSMPQTGLLSSVCTCVRSIMLVRARSPLACLCAPVQQLQPSPHFLARVIEPNHMGLVEQRLNGRFQVEDASSWLVDKLANLLAHHSLRFLLLLQGFQTFLELLGIRLLALAFSE